MSDIKQYVFVVYVYESEISGTFQHSTEVRVVASTVAEAIKEAKRLIPGRDNVHVKTIIDEKGIRKLRE